MYATKRRRRSIKTTKPPMKEPQKSNPSKRHRERLNSELDHLASLLPFEQSVISKLDKLSILRLAVSYLRTKSYFHASLQERFALEAGRHHLLSHNHLYSEPSFTDTDSVLQALSGFLFAVACDGEVFFASRTVEQYLGFHQSDIIHQSALELIHSEDREEFKSQLNWRSRLPPDQPDMTLQQLMMPENAHLLHRCFTVRFRCLLDNTSGFITLEISGWIRILKGQTVKPDAEPPLSLFALCCPFGPLPLLDVPPREYTFKSKHKMDMSPVSMDPRGKLLFGYSDTELSERGGYDLIHPDDLAYYAAAHEELIKTGSSGLIAYRLLTKDSRWIWLQTSTKVMYKNSKPDFVIGTHRHLTEDEGRELVGKRGNEFKLPYPIIDSDPSGLLSGLDEVDDANKGRPARNKKNKTQLRDYLQAGRKRKTPYRDVYPGLNGYGYSYTAACQATDAKADLVYPYTPNNLAQLDADVYRTAAAYHPLGGAMYGSEGLRLDGDKHAYTNGYYLEPRQYQHTLQYHGNGYDMAKYGYDMTKYTGYESQLASYGLDLSKRAGHFDNSPQRYDTADTKYTYDYSSERTKRVSGVAYDALRNSALYGTNSLLDIDGLMACNTSSACSLYARMEAAADRYPQSNASRADTRTVSRSSALDSTTDDDTLDCTQKQAANHMSVIRSLSPRKSPGCSSQYRTADSLARCSPSWPQSPADKHNASPTAVGVSCIVSPGKDVRHGGGVVCNGSVITAPTSVIQQHTARTNRSCEKQVSGGIAVPVVKSSSSWLNSLPASSYDWHMGTTANDNYSCHEKTLRAYEGYTSSDNLLTASHHTRTIMETPKVVCYNGTW